MTWGWLSRMFLRTWPQQTSPLKSGLGCMKLSTQGAQQEVDFRQHTALRSEIPLKIPKAFLECAAPKPTQSRQTRPLPNVLKCMSSDILGGSLQHPGGYCRVG